MLQCHEAHVFIYQVTKLIVSNIYIFIYQIIKNITTSIVVTEEIFEYPGIFRGSFFMNCELPEMRRKRSIDNQKFVEGYDISVSNNGQVFTEPLKIIIFDSLCFKCNLTVLLCDELVSNCIVLNDL